MGFEGSILRLTEEARLYGCANMENLCWENSWTADPQELQTRCLKNTVFESDVGVRYVIPHRSTPTKYRNGRLLALMKNQQQPNRIRIGLAPKSRPKRSRALPIEVSG